jgi:septal ring factor EnvC (AmiA/AmiB activator)
MYSFLIKTIFLIFFIAAFSGVALAQPVQTKEQLQQQQKQLQREIDELNVTLNSIRKNKKQSITQLAIIQRKIAKREQLVNNINREITHINDDIYNKEVEQTRLKKELDTLKQKYAQSIVFAYKNSNDYEYLNFLFSAKDFNDALKRFQYLKSYRTYRETQAQTIIKTQNLLKQGIVDLNNSKNEKNKALQNQSQQLQVLEEDKQEKNNVLKDLKGKESGISAEIGKREKKQRELKSAIAAAIRREVEEAKRKEKERLAKLKSDNKATADNSSSATNIKPSSATSGVKSSGSNRAYSSLESTPEGKELSIKFENNKHNLPWPVSGGYVSHEFGTQQIGPNLKENNIGIYIAVKVGTSVKCVADGEVSRVIDMTDGSLAVVVVHGKYFTTYSNLSSVYLRAGDKVWAGTVLGKAGTNLEGNGEITFMVADDSGNFLDPRSWLK